MLRFPSTSTSASGRGCHTGLGVHEDVSQERGRKAPHGPVPASTLSVCELCKAHTSLKYPGKGSWDQGHSADSAEQATYTQHI